MTHARQQIRDSFVTALTLIPNTTVYNGRIFPLYDTVLPAITVFSREEAIDDEAGRQISQQHRTLNMSVQCYLKVEESLDDDMDQLSASVEQSVFNSSAIHGLVRCLDLISTEIEVSQDGENPMGTCTLTFQCKFLTTDGNPEVILT